MPDHVTKYHPVVAATRKAFGVDARSPEAEQLRREGVVDIAVSKSMRPRALRLLNAMFVEAERRGATVRPGWDQQRHTHVGAEIAFDGQGVEVKVREAGPGQLRLEISGWLPQGIYRRWTDGKATQVEDRLHQVLESAKLTAEAAAERADLEERKRLRRAEIDHRSREAAMSVYEQHVRVGALQAQVAAWRLARDIRDYAAAVSETSTERPEATHEWIAWALRYAEEIEDLRPSEPQIPSPSEETLRPLIAEVRPAIEAAIPPPDPPPGPKKAKAQRRRTPTDPTPVEIREFAEIFEVPVADAITLWRSGRFPIDDQGDRIFADRRVVTDWMEEDEVEWHAWLEAHAAR